MGIVGRRYAKQAVGVRGRRNAVWVPEVFSFRGGVQTAPRSSDAAEHPRSQQRLTMASSSSKRDTVTSRVTAAAARDALAAQDSCGGPHAGSRQTKHRGSVWAAAAVITEVKTFRRLGAPSAAQPDSKFCIYLLSAGEDGLLFFFARRGRPPITL